MKSIYSILFFLFGITFSSHVAFCCFKKKRKKNKNMTKVLPLHHVKAAESPMTRKLSHEEEQGLKETLASLKILGNSNKSLILEDV